MKLNGVMWIREVCTNTGFYKVSRVKDKKYHNGFYYRYWCDNVVITRVSILDLEKEVQKRGFDWYIIDKDLANKTILESENIIFYKLPKNNTTGYYHVTIQKSNTTKQGFLYKYQYKTNKGYRAITSKTIEDLQEKVEAKGLLWFALNSK